MLRMPRHLSQQNDVVTLAPVQLPQTGSHYLLALGRNPDGTYGSGNEGLIYVDGETVAYADGVPFSTELTGEEFVEAIRQKADRNDPPASTLTHGSPPPPAPSGAPLHGDPGPSLKFGDVNYVYSGSAELPSGEDADFVINGTEIGMDDLERVGTTNEGNTAGIREGLAVYRLKDDRTNDVYTFRPGKDHVNPEDGQIFEGQDVWTRWTTRQEVDRNDSPTPDLTHGSPPPPAPSGAPLHGSPQPSLKFDDVGYVYSGSTELPSGEGTDFVINGTEINVDDLEVVGNTGIPDGLRALPRCPAPGVCLSAESRMVYRLKGAGTNEVYTFNPGEDHVNPEDGQIFKGQDVWTRWTTQ